MNREDFVTVIHNQCDRSYVERREARLGGFYADGEFRRVPGSRWVLSKWIVTYSASSSNFHLPLSVQTIYVPLARHRPGLNFVNFNIIMII